MRIALPVIIVSIAILAASCSREGPSDQEKQLARGQAIYEQGCATSTCHGVHGEGILDDNAFRVWPLVGEQFQRRNPTAQVIFDVVRSGRESSLRAFTDQEIYDAIAYELSLNGVSISALLTSQNAPTTYSGSSVETPQSGSLFPPPGNVQLIASWLALTLPVCAEDGELRLCVTQMALVDSIGINKLSSGGQYVLIVSTMEVLADQPLEVGPQFLRLVSKDGLKLEPLEINLDYPVTRFSDQIIQSEHGTAFLGIFALPESSEIGYLHYTTPARQPLIVELIP
jgi:hypothetical protein